MTLIAGCIAGAMAQVENPGAALSKELALPVDPQPGSFLPDTGARTTWAVLDTLDLKAGFGTARSEPDNKPVSFRLLPYTSLWRFGAPGAAGEDFRGGERVLLKLVRFRRPKPPADGSYALEVRDEISEQVRTGRSYRIGSQDRENYRFTVEPLDEKSSPAGEPLTLEYGRGTFLVLREDPVYVFNVRPGTRVWLNTGYPKGSDVRTAREVLDEPSLKRYQSGQRLRMAARLDAKGGSGYLTANSTRSAQVQVFPDLAEWARRLQPGEEVRLARVGTEISTQGVSSRVRTVRGESGPITVELEGAVTGIKPKERILLLPIRKDVSYARDVRPILESHCLACHRDGDARSGYSLSTPEKMLAGSRRGPGVVPGKSDQSLLYLTMSGGRNPRMPPDRDATPEQLDLIKRWIDSGAKTE